MADTGKNTWKSQVSPKSAEKCLESAVKVEPLNWPQQFLSQLFLAAKQGSQHLDFLSVIFML